MRTLRPVKELVNGNRIGRESSVTRVGPKATRCHKLDRIADEDAGGVYGSSPMGSVTTRHHRALDP